MRFLSPFIHAFAFVLPYACAQDSSSAVPNANNTNATRYAILDNDWSPTAFIPFLLALDAGMDVLGLASDTANTWVGQTTLHGVS